MRELNENLFKGCIKRKISFTASTFVKFLITGTVALSLTACGGGGGGGGSSSSGSGNTGGSGSNIVITYPEINNIKPEKIIDKDGNFDENIIIDKAQLNYAGLKVSKNSNVTINNSGKIEISGENGITGVVVSGNSKVVNKGTIKVSSDYLHESKTENFPIDVAVKYMSKGMFITDNSTGINEGIIEIEGSTTGILAYGKGSTGINKGTIKIVGDTSGSTWEEAPTIGMVSVVGGKVVNEGIISGSVYGQMGMFSYKGELINNGTIQLSENDSYGMVAQEGYIENGENGKIILSHGTGRDPNHYYSIANEAIEVESGKAVNKGKIEINNKYIYGEYDYPNIDFDDIADIGMYGSDGAEIINEKTGIINISGSTIGMMIDGGDGKENIGINKGTINIAGDITGSTWEEVPTIGMVSVVGGKVVNEGTISGLVYGQMGMLSYQGKLINNGKIHLSANDSYGMVVQDGYIENGENGKIILSHDYTTGSDTNEAIEVSNGKGINKGKIEVENRYNYGAFNYPDADFDDIVDRGMYGSDGAEIINEKTGIINISGSTVGMMIDGEYGGNNKAVNNGVINIASNEIPVDADNLIPSVGMAVEDSGIIENNYLITGNSTSVVAMGSMNSGKGENIVTNNGVIQLRGSDLHGMQNLVGNGNMTNNQLIELKGSGLYGMQGVGKLTNNGTIKLTIEKIDENNYFSVGMDIWEADATNNGKIIIDNKIGTYVEGVAIDEEGGKFTNKGLIEINGGYGAGIDTGYVPYIDGVNRPELQKEAIAINDETGVIRVAGTSDFNEMYGMIADGPKASIINRGEINANGKNSFGMGTYGGATAENYGTIVMNGKLHIDKTNITSDTFKGMSAEGEKGQITNNGTIELKHTIDLINPYDDKGLEPNITKNAIGMEASNGAIAINNKDIIGQGEITGMSAENGSIAKNAGNIKLTSIHYDGKVEWDPDIITKKYPSYTVGLYGTGNGTKVENTGVIDIIGDGVAIEAVDEAIGSNSGEINLSSQILEVEGNHETQYTFPKGLEARGTGTVENLEDGKININGHAVGIRVRDNGKGYNYGIINISSNNYARGMEVRENGYVENHGDIIFNSGEGMGIRVKNNGTAENFGRIYVKDNSYGIATLLDADDIVGNSASATNNGNITVIGTNSIGMQAFNSCTVTNGKDGIINVNGQGSYGMQATGVGAIANNYGIINVGDEASGGMVATEGGYIYNNGVINIDKAHSFDTQEDAENFAMQIDGTSTMKNEGTINTNADIKVEASGIYVIGTNRDGSYGRISARNMNLDGDVIVETDIVRGDYKKEHILENVVEAEDIKLGEDISFKSTSLLYNASVEKDVFGNLDAKLERNSNNISDFTDEKFVNVSSIFDDYINNEDEYNKLSSVEKDVVDTIFDYSTSSSSLKNAIDQVVGTEYLNVQRQIFDIKNSFRKFDSSLISSLDNYDFNFQFIGEYSDISSKNGISGYESKMTGFNGAAKLSENLYGVLGYGYSDIDYDGNSDGKIQTIHTGIYKDSIVQEYNLRTGVYGEYNFHENNRAIFDKNAESDFNSYLVGVSGEVNKKYGKELYIQPSLSLDIAYGNIESFNESKADGFNLKVDEENYTSILPKLKMDLGREFTNSKVFASIGYSYELGDMDKDMTIELLNKKADVKNNEMEHGQFDISVGGSLNINDLSLNAEIGKEFGRRDREYVRAGFSYRF